MVSENTTNVYNAIENTEFVVHVNRFMSSTSNKLKGYTLDDGYEYIILAEQLIVSKGVMCTVWIVNPYTRTEIYQKISPNPYFIVESILQPLDATHVKFHIREGNIYIVNVGKGLSTESYTDVIIPLDILLINNIHTDGHSLNEYIVTVRELIRRCEEISNTTYGPDCKMELKLGDKNILILNGEKLPKDISFDLFAKLVVPILGRGRNDHYYMKWDGLQFEVSNNIEVLRTHYIFNDKYFTCDGAFDQAYRTYHKVLNTVYQLPNIK